MIKRLLLFLCSSIRKYSLIHKYDLAVYLKGFFFARSCSPEDSDNISLTGFDRPLVCARVLMLFRHT